MLSGLAAPLPALAGPCCGGVGTTCLEPVHLRSAGASRARSGDRDRGHVRRGRARGDGERSCEHLGSRTVLGHRCSLFTSPRRCVAQARVARLLDHVHAESQPILAGSITTEIDQAVRQAAYGYRKQHTAPASRDSSRPREVPRPAGGMAAAATGIHLARGRRHRVGCVTNPALRSLLVERLTHAAVATSRSTTRLNSVVRPWRRFHPRGPPGTSRVPHRKVPLWLRLSPRRIALRHETSCPPSPIADASRPGPAPTPSSWPRARW